VTDTDISVFIGFCRNIIQIVIYSQVLTPFFPLRKQGYKKAEV